MQQNIAKKHILKSLDNSKIILGNGFDLYCGLKTKYADFFNSNQNLLKTIKTWISRISVIKYYTEYEEFEIEYILPNQKLHDSLTIWDIFFYLNSGFENENINWCDIEETMRSSFVYKNNIILRSKIIWKNVYDLLVSESIFQFESVTYEEKYCAYYLKKLFTVTTYHDFIHYLFEELLFFEKRFGEYVKKQIKSDDYRVKANEIISKITRFSFKNINIDTFNYSSFTLDSPHCHQINIYNINGNINSPIFGIDSVCLTPNDEEYIFTKTLRKMKLSYAVDYINKQVNFSNLVIFGHSMNEQDYNYYFPLFNKIGISKSDFKGKIIIVYSIYDDRKKDKIETEIILRFNKMIFEYEEYTTANKVKRLADILYTNNNVIFVDIDKV